MPNTKVLVVDDSITMRALFSDVLERAKGVEVVGAANGAAEAAEMIESLRPDVITLDVEMPGKSGLEFLEELMADRPMPVIMLSTLTQKGAETSFKALELGAVDCFPKPMRATPDEFNAIAGKLGKLVIAAANGKVGGAKKKSKAANDIKAFDWNGKMVAMSASTGGIEAISNMLTSFPRNCPPTIILLQTEPGFAEPFVAKLNGAIEPEAVLATDGIKLEQGKIYLAADPEHHVVIDRWPDASIRLLPNAPVGGFRPSADLLFSALSKTAADKAVGLVLTGMGSDGAAGLKAMRNSGSFTLCQDKATAMVYEAPTAALAAHAVESELPLDQIPAALFQACGKV